MWYMLMHANITFFLIDLMNKFQQFGISTYKWIFPPEIYNIVVNLVQQWAHLSLLFWSFLTQMTTFLMLFFVFICYYSCQQSQVVDVSK